MPYDQRGLDEGRAPDKLRLIADLAEAVGEMDLSSEEMRTVRAVAHVIGSICADSNVEVTVDVLFGAMVGAMTGAYVESEGVTNIPSAAIPLGIALLGRDLLEGR